MGTQLVLSFAKRYFFNLSNALNSKHNSQTIRILSPYRNISLFSLVFILIVKDIHYKLFWGKASIRHRWRLHKIILVKFNCEKVIR